MYLSIRLTYPEQCLQTKLAFRQGTQQIVLSMLRFLHAGKQEAYRASQQAR